MLPDCQGVFLLYTQYSCANRTTSPVNMTDCNANQLVVKAQIENDCAAAQDQQVAMADQATAQQTAPAAPGVAPSQLERTQHQVEIQTSEQDQSATVPDVSHEITIDNTESDKPAFADLDPQTLGAGATLSDLDRIGLGTRIIRTTRASETIREGEQPSTSGVVDSQPASTSQGSQDLLGDTDISGMDILDIDVDGSEDFSDFDPETVEALLGGGPEEMIKNGVAGCNRGMTAEQGPKTQPSVETELESLDLADEAVDRAVPSADCAQTAPGPPVLPEETTPEEMDATEGGSSTAEAQPGLTRRGNTIRIEKVGEFFREDGQPLFLNAYPPVTRPTVLKVDDPDQAYKGQDLVDPSTIRPRHTRCERLRH